MAILLPHLFKCWYYRCDPHFWLLSIMWKISRCSAPKLPSPACKRPGSAPEMEIGVVLHFYQRAPWCCSYLSVLRRKVDKGPDSSGPGEGKSRKLPCPESGAGKMFRGRWSLSVYLKNYVNHTGLTKIYHNFQVLQDKAIPWRSLSPSCDVGLFPFHVSLVKIGQLVTRAGEGPPSQLDWGILDLQLSFYPLVSLSSWDLGLHLTLNNLEPSIDFSQGRVKYARHNSKTKQGAIQPQCGACWRTGKLCCVLRSTHCCGERAALTMACLSWGSQHSDGELPRGRKPIAQASQVDEANRLSVSQADQAVNTEINRNDAFYSMTF